MIFRKWLDVINKYLSLIIIIPALLGGLWQIIELSSISFSYIRFFSVTQMIPDGLLILFFLILFGYSSIFLFWLAKISSNDNRSTKDGSNLENKKKVFYVLLYLLLLILWCIGIIFFNNYIINNIDSFFCILIFIPTNVLLFVLMNQTIKKILDSLSETMLGKVSNKIFEYFLLSLKISYLSIFFLFAIKFHDAFFLPLKLRNIENLICKVEKLEPHSSLDILYLNDKYIFIRINSPSKNLINNIYNSNEMRIFKFDDLLDDTSCIGSKKIREQFVKDSIIEWNKPKFIR